jgi:hypothetical protein
MSELFGLCSGNIRCRNKLKTAAILLNTYCCWQCGLHSFSLLLKWPVYLRVTLFNLIKYWKNKIVEFFNWIEIFTIFSMQFYFMVFKLILKLILSVQVQYRKSIKNVTFSSTNHDLFQKKEYFFQIKDIFDSKKWTSLAPLR